MNEKEPDNSDTTLNRRLGISTGFAEIDKATGGFVPGELIVLASLPGKGKSALAISMLGHIALKGKTVAGFISLKMNAETLKKRFIAQEAKMPVDTLSEPFLPVSDIPGLKKAEEEITKAPIFLIDKRSMSITEIHSEMLRMVRENEVKIVFIDIISSVKGIKFFESWPEQASEITFYIKRMSVEFDIPIVALVQMNINGDPFKNVYLMISADVFMVLTRRIDGDTSEAALSIAKRWQPLGTFKLRFLKEFLMFETRSEI